MVVIRWDVGSQKNGIIVRREEKRRETLIGVKMDQK